ncbi:MAG: DUF2339 domain-containing protein [Verrucomicrobiales bacterium]|nr:DUF2339 domain-containing protein [Verrucomicrobiales bacterium]MCP5519812.1 DUF2339 domain-containing protein [Verrucomicrobiales bacterium]
MEALLVFLILTTAVGVLARQLSVLRRELREMKEQVARLRHEMDGWRQVPVQESAVPPPAPDATGGKPATPPIKRATIPPDRSPTTPPRIPPMAAPPAFVPAPAQVQARSASPVAANAAPPPPFPSPKAPRALRQIDWERFLGVRLFAWIGGFALFLALAFFIKYSFDNNLISPAMRITLGFLSGLGLLGGGITLRRKAYEVTAQTLAATGIVTLYTTCFACHGIYRFTGLTTTFAMMILVTVAALILAVRMEARVVAVLGLVGGFLTPFLLSSGEDRPLALFGYVLLLDAGLLAVAFRQRWPFLAMLGALGTGLMEIAWQIEFFHDGKELTLWLILASFNALFLGALWFARRWRCASAFVTAAPVGLALLTFLFAAWQLPRAWVWDRPVLFLAFVFLADACCLVAAFREPPLRRLIPVAGGLSFAILAGWTNSRLAETSLGWALLAFLLYGLLHGALPLMLSSEPRDRQPPRWLNVFPSLALALFAIPLFNEMAVGAGLWISLLFGALLATAVGLATGTRTPVVIACGLVTFVLGLDVGSLPREAGLVLGSVFRIGLFGGLFLLAATFTAWWGDSLSDAPDPADRDPATTLALPGVLPFVLLSMVILRLPLSTPHWVFLGTLVLGVMLLALARLLHSHRLVPLALGGILLVQLAWHVARFRETAAAAPLVWNLLFLVIFVAFPMVAWRSNRPPVVPWATAALAPIPHFFLIYNTIERAWNPDHPGWIPLTLALPAAALLWQLLRTVERQAPQRNTLLAWAGGSLLFFLTLVFPIQFERQWLTIGWALEGLALLWLFRRIPHPGLRTTGFGLLVAAFVRLSMNPAVLEYGAQTGAAVFNWFLYTYGLVALAAFLAARLSAPDWRISQVTVRAWLNTLGAILAFLLLNLEIANYFSPGPTVELRFTGSFARDMSYSIAWGLFAFGLLIIGVVKRQGPVRYAGAGLLVATLGKLFLHDLLMLTAPYRIGAFFGVAVLAILASAVYQRFFASEGR